MTVDNHLPTTDQAPLILINAMDWSGGTSGATCATDGHCVTCADEALPATVIEVDQVDGMALVEVNSARSEVDITLVDAVQPGQVLLVHGGVAIALLEQQ